MSSVGFEPTISAGERPQAHALDRAATGTGYSTVTDYKTHLDKCNDIVYCSGSLSARQ